MSNLRLTIDLLPKGAWGNDFSKTLSKKDWDTLRNHAYAKANHRCVICGSKDSELDAHEVWDFDVGAKTQRLKDIIALCPACHGVKHMRNSERIGYGDSAKAHFLKVNNCSQMVFAKHYAEQQFLFEERNNVLRWKVKADLSRFGGRDIKVKERHIPLVSDPYDGVDWQNAFQVKDNDMVYLLSHEELERGAAKETYARYMQEKYKSAYASGFPSPPKICYIRVDNYTGTIEVTCSYTNKIQWISRDGIIKTKYNFGGKFITTISVENLHDAEIAFKLIGNYGIAVSQKFKLMEVL